MSDENQIPEVTPQVDEPLVKTGLSIFDDEETTDPQVTPQEENTDAIQTETAETQEVEPAQPEVKQPEIAVDFNSISFEEPKAPEFESVKYLKEWGAESLDAVKEQQPVLYELLTKLDTLQKEKYELEKSTYELKNVPEVKAAVVSQQVIKYMADNEDAWITEFTTDVLSKDEAKALNKLNKTQQKTLGEYVDKLATDYVLERKLANKQVYNPFVFFKSEIKAKLAEIIQPTQGQPAPTKQSSLTLDQRKAMMSPTGNINTTPIPKIEPQKYQPLVKTDLSLFD